MPGVQQDRSAVLVGKIHRASDLLGEHGHAAVHRVLPVVSALRPLLPGHGLRRGATIAVRTAQPAGTSRPAGPVTGLAAGWQVAQPTGRRGAGLTLAPPADGPVVATSLMLALLAEASQAGSWCAVVGVPTLGAAAAAELGIALDRLALVPYPGPEWVDVVAALVDGVDVVVVASPGPVAAQVTSRLTARARQRGCVLVPLISWSGRSASLGPWEGTDLVLESMRAVWEGLGQGRGRLCRREVTISAHGRGAAARRKQVRIWLPAAPVGWIGAELTGPPERTALTVIDGAGDRAGGDSGAGDSGAIGEAV